MYQFCGALAAKLEKNIGAVSVQGADAYVESLANLFPALSLSYEFEHLPLTR